MSSFESYATRYKFVHMERKDGVLQVRLHKNGGPAEWNGDRNGIHDELGQAFYEIGRDRDNRVVILTGTGDHFLIEVPTALEGTGTAVWDRLYKESKDLLMNLLDIEVPVIGAVNGPAFIHAELVTMSDLVISSERASFADKVHFPGAGVPGDGVHVWWPMLLGPNRGRQFLLTGEEIGAEEAKRLGFVAEVVPHERCLTRAWEVARAFAQKPQMLLRMTRAAFTQNIKRRMLEDLSHGLLCEGLGFLAAFEGKS
jgi:enoyl-CoA hydratase/carnithine racemase